MRIEPDQAAAVIVDIQENLMPAMPDRKGFLKRTVFLIECLKTLNIPLTVTQQYTKGLGDTLEEIRRAAGTEDYLEKMSFSCYDPIEPAVREKKFILLCGMEAHICVQQTVIDLCEHGYVPVLPVDCITSRSEEDKTMAILRMREEGAILTTSESLVYELMKKAGTEEFKKILKLVKQ